MTFDDWYWQKLVDPEFRIQYTKVEDLLREAWHEAWQTTALQAELRENELTEQLTEVEKDRDEWKNTCAFSHEKRVEEAAICCDWKTRALRAEQQIREVCTLYERGKPLGGGVILDAHDLTLVPLTSAWYQAAKAAGGK